MEQLEIIDEMDPAAKKKKKKPTGMREPSLWERMTGKRAASGGQSRKRTIDEEIMKAGG